LTIPLVSYATPKCENGIMVCAGPLTAQGGANDQCNSFRYCESAADFDQNLRSAIALDLLWRSQLSPCLLSILWLPHASGRGSN
jgi:hypothetical protein